MSITLIVFGKTTYSQYTISANGTSIRINPGKPSCDYDGQKACTSSPATSTSNQCHSFKIESYIKSGCVKVTSSNVTRQNNTTTNNNTKTNTKNNTKINRLIPS